MTTIDNSKIFLDGVYADVSLYVPASTTYVEGTVLGRDADDNLTAFTSTTAGSEPLYILAQDVTNSDTSETTVDFVRALDFGTVDADKLTFINSDDASDVDVLDAMKKNGFKLANVQQLIRNI